MIKITYPDNSVKEKDMNVTPYDLAMEISPSLAKKAIIAKINGKFHDMKAPILEDASFELVTNGVEGLNDVLNHSCAHLLANAIVELYPNAHFGVGPAIEEGFYYDMDLGDVKLTDEDLVKIEKKMASLVAGGAEISRKELSKEEALEFFKNDPYKTELISEMEEGTIISTYTQGSFTDLCRGPHVSSVKFLKNFKLLTVSGAYWRGDAKRAQLQRIYGTCFLTEEELKQHLINLEERKKRDHKKLGKDMELFMLSDFGPGLPFMLPNGYVMRRCLEDMWIKKHKAAGYLQIETPIMLNRELWETSGHWDHYKDDMFTTAADETDYAIKPMNCPGAILVYKNSLHSYKELPLRYSEIGHVHRYEASGALNGLFRVRGFHQDDAHTLLRKDQIGKEISSILKLYDEIYSIFGLDYSIELSTRPEENYIGDIKVWDEAEKKLAECCIKTGHKFKINPGDGAFYGPKLDFKLRDSMNRIWQCGTVQLDMQLPGRFDCYYIDENGEKVTPIMIHRACFGSFERFMAIITENYGGVFPTWLAPIQMVAIPVSNEAHLKYSNKLVKKLKDKGFRVNLDDRDEKLGYKIRESQTKKIPYTLVIGDNEVKDNSITYRHHGSQEQITVSFNEFCKMIKKEVESYGLKE